MTRLLHLVTVPEHVLAETVISLQRENPQYDVQVVNLAVEDVDYAEVVDRIFASDSVAVW